MAHSRNKFSKAAIVLLLSTACHRGRNVLPQAVTPKPQAAHAKLAPAVAETSILPVMPTSNERHAAVPKDAGAIAEGTRCPSRASLPAGPQLAYLPPRDVAPALLEQNLVNTIWTWPLIESHGLPAVSEDGRTVLLLDDARPFTGPPRFDVRLIERDVDRIRPDRNTVLIAASELEATLPAWPEGKTDNPDEMRRSYESARVRFEQLKQKVRARIETARMRIAAEKWAPMPWCDAENSGSDDGVGRVDELRVSLVQAAKKFSPVLRVTLENGTSLLDRADAALVAHARSSAWGSCTYEPHILLVAADQQRRVVVVLVNQVGPSDICDIPPTFHVYRLAPLG